jgi:hypothetical protein
MDLDPTPKTKDLQLRLKAFMEEHIYPNEALFHNQIEAHRWTPTAIVEELKTKARAAGPLESVSSWERTRCWFVESRVCASVRDHGP